MSNGHTLPHAPPKKKQKTVAKDDKVVLNVGGIKYETYQSTLTAHPDTLLGAMFLERNRSLLQPSENNEYFFDRDGHTFRYILEYYRKGRITWQEATSTSSRSSNAHHITYEELLEELDYFQINKDPTSVTLDKFIDALKHAILEARAHLFTRIVITFPGTDYTLKNFQVSPNSAGIVNVLRPFERSGYNFLEMFGVNIGKYLKEQVPKLSFVLRRGTTESFDLHLDIGRDVIDKERIFQDSVLSNDRNRSGIF
ncbi:hypothetical protein G9A89_023510 [Geosiphon pyriformis]|nr:hypothetical protein G9A89_023510 [Geosiphon pyriformis]